MVKKINLSLPRQWNACSREQLETIAAVMGEQVARQDRYHPFSMLNVKVALFFVFAGIEIVKGPNPEVPVEDQYYTCRFSDKGRRLFRRKKSAETFSLYLWQINYWLSPKSKAAKGTVENLTQGAGILDWLDSESEVFLTKFVYEEVKRRKAGKWFACKRTFKGPLMDLDGFSWAQYRFATETMANYTKLSNSLLKMQELSRFTPEQIAQQTRNIDLAKAMFLATIFNSRTDFVDTNTGMVKHDFHYESNQCVDNAEYFRSFPEVQWQVILFWWTGIMYTLSKRYPHVFKVQKIDRKKHVPTTPLEVYTATTATMQKYAGLTEDQVNNQSYSLVLEHLERLSKENEELDKSRRRK